MPNFIGDDSEELAIRLRGKFGFEFLLLLNCQKYEESKQNRMNFTLRDENESFGGKQ